MKLLVTDIGNTNVKYAVFENNEILHYAKTDSKNIVKGIKKSIKKFSPPYTLCADVTGQLKSVEKAFKNTRLLKWDKKLKLPFINKYRSQTIGQDRLALAAGGQHLYPGQNVLIISLGTCITYDFINDRSEYLGGAISPGLQMRARALKKFTAKLPAIKIKSEFPLTGNTTQSSILSGVMNGSLHEMKGIIAQYKDKYPDLKAIITGGDMNYFEAELKNEIFAPHLTLVGLNKILQLNIREV